MNIVKTRESQVSKSDLETHGNFDASELIQLRNLMISSQGGIYERKVTQIVDEIGIFAHLNFWRAPRHLCPYWLFHIHVHLQTLP